MGGNVIDKIQCNNKIGCDIHKQLIELLKYTRDYSYLIPDIIAEEEYNKVKSNKEQYEDWYLGLIGFCATFGAKYFGGYRRNSKGDNSGEGTKSAIKNLKKQASNLQNCDPPYKNTTKYKTGDFPYEEFYQWCKDMSKDNVVLISEYNMPDDFTCIWQKETKVNFDSNRKSNDEKNKRIEKLYIYKK